MEERSSASIPTLHVDDLHTHTQKASSWHRHPHALREGTRSPPTCVPPFAHTHERRNRENASNHQHICISSRGWRYLSQPHTHNFVLSPLFIVMRPRPMREIIQNCAKIICLALLATNLCFHKFAPRSRRRATCTLDLPI